MPAPLITNGGNDLHHALLLLFNRSLHKGVLPADYKRAKAFPLFKGKGSRADPNNYRLICVTSIFARIFERMVTRRMRARLEGKGFFLPDQAGFRAGFSTTDNILQLEEAIYRALRRKCRFPPYYQHQTKSSSTRATRAIKSFERSLAMHVSESITLR